jgi:hypothetical protein
VSTWARGGGEKRYENWNEEGWNRGCLSKTQPGSMMCLADVEMGFGEGH